MGWKKEKDKIPSSVKDRNELRNIKSDSCESQSFDLYLYQTVDDRNIAMIVSSFEERRTILEGVCQCIFFLLVFLAKLCVIRNNCQLITHEKTIVRVLILAKLQATT